jgi:hypothetical protein
MSTSLPIPDRFRDVFFPADGVTIYYPRGLARDGYVVDNDERLAQLLAVAWPLSHGMTWRGYVLFILAFPILLAIAESLPGPAAYTLCAVICIGAVAWSRYRFRTRILPLFRDLPRVPPREPSGWALFVRNYPSGAAIMGLLIFGVFAALSVPGPLLGTAIFLGISVLSAGLLIAKIVLRRRAAR